MTGPEWLQPILEWLNANPTWAGVIIFTVALCESLLVVGVLVPGALVMLAFGALIAMGTIELWSTLIWAIAGAIVGDAISFWIGYYFKDRLKTVWPFKKHPKMLERGEEFFVRHGGKSVVLGRFVGPVRAVIPTVAGIMGMTPRRFTIINVLSAIAWAPTYILPGVAVGASLGLASQVATRFGLLVFGLIILLLIVAWIIKRIFRALQPHAKEMLDGIVAWGREHPRLGRYITPLVDPNQPEAGSLALVAALLISCSWLFSILFINAYTSTYIINVDETMYSLFQDLRTPWVDSIMISLSQLGDSNVTIPITIAITIYLALRHHPKTAAYWVAALMFAFISAFILKALLGVPRPSPMYDGLSMFAFPSGHATINMVMYGFLAVMVAHVLQPQLRWIPYALAGVVTCSIALSRIYLGAHWLSDVLGGLSLGLIWVILLGTAYRRHCAPLTQLPRFSLVFIVTLTLATTLHISMHHEREIQRYNPIIEPLTIASDEWWEKDWATLPDYRIDIKKQHSQQPITLQWAGDIEQIQNALATQGWSVAPKFTTAASLLWLSPDAQLNDLPILPRAHNGHHEPFIMKKYVEGESKLFAIRFWNSHHVLSTGESIFIGYITELTLEHTSFFTHLSQSDDYKTPQQMLPGTLAGWQLKQVSSNNGHSLHLIKPDTP